MHTMPYLIQNSALVWCVQRKVPKKLQAAVARILGGKKPAQVYLKKSLATKDRRVATQRATHALADIDRILREAEALVKRPTPKAALRSNLADTEIKRMAEYVYAKALSSDERIRFGRDEWKRMEAEHNRLHGTTMEPWAISYDQMPPHGFSPAMLAEQREQLVEDLRDMREYLALGDIAAVEDHTLEALSVFGIDLDRKSAAYPKLGMEVLRAYVRALQAIEKRNAGYPVETPALPRGPLSTPVSGCGTLREAFEGWNKTRARPADTVTEYNRAVEMFIQLHGNLAVAEIKRRHALEFREAIQLVPSRRSGNLLKAALPELSAWGREHPEVPKVSAGTINKQLGAVQAIGLWAHDHGLMPDNITWSDPFQRLRVEEDRSERAPFVTSELQVVFDAPLFTAHEWPVGARGAAGVWLPLLSLFTGARQSELAGLKASNIKEDDATGTPLMFIVSDRRTSRRLKSKSSERVIPVHPQLIELGFLRFVNERRSESADAWLFPLVSPENGRAGVKAWSKWFSGHLRNKVGMKDTAKVFHSFRHGVTDALRRGRVDFELREALVGHSQGSTVSGGYGASEMLARWGVEAMQGAVAKISYPGLDLSRVRPFAVRKRTRGSK